MSTKRLASASIANLVIPLSGLVISPFLSRALGPDGRGLYAALTLPIVVCGWLGTFGLQDALSFHLRNDKLSRRNAGTVTLLAAVPLGLVGIAGMALLGLFVFRGQAHHYGQFLVLALFAPVHIVANLLIGSLSGSSDLRGVNLVKVVPALVRTALVVSACLAFNVNAFVAALLFMVTMVPGVLVGFARLRRPDEPGRRVEAGIPARSLATYSLACLPGVLAAVSSARLDQIIGLPVIGPAQLGYYAVAVSVAEIPMVIATAARTLLLGRATSDDPVAATRVARVALIVSVATCGLLAMVSRFAVPFVFGDRFGPSVTPTVILCLATVLYTGMVLLTAVLLAHGSAAWSSAALVIGSLVGVGLLFVFAPWGATGAACASLVGYGVSWAVAAWAVWKRRTPYTLRMLSLPYREDVSLVRARVARVLARRPAQPIPAPASTGTDA